MGYSRADRLFAVGANVLDVGAVTAAERNACEEGLTDATQNEAEHPLFYRATGRGLSHHLGLSSWAVNTHRELGV